MPGEGGGCGPSVALFGKMPRRSGGPRAICGLVGRDAWAGGGMRGHLWPCGERCLGRRRDAGPSVALCGEMLGRGAGPRAICVLVRKDAAPKAADHGPSLASGPVGPQATRHEVRPRVWWTLHRLG